MPPFARSCARARCSSQKWIDACAADLQANQRNLNRCRRRTSSSRGSRDRPRDQRCARQCRPARSTSSTVPACVRRSLDCAIWPARSRRGSVKTLVILGGNPVYNAPADLDWAKLQGSVPQVVRYGYYVDETSALSQRARRGDPLFGVLGRRADGGRHDRAGATDDPAALQRPHGFRSPRTYPRRNED